MTAEDLEQIRRIVGDELSVLVARIAAVLREFEEVSRQQQALQEPRPS